MANYRKRIKIFPGLHMNLSGSGISFTAGVRGFSVTTGRRGTYLNQSLPGTGIYQCRKIGGGRRRGSYSAPTEDHTPPPKGCAVALLTLPLILLFLMAYMAVGAAVMAVLEYPGAGILILSLLWAAGSIWLLFALLRTIRDVIRYRPEDKNRQDTDKESFTFVSKDTHHDGMDTPYL